MLFLLFTVGVILVGVSGRLFVRAIAIPRLALKRHLREIQDYGFESPREELELSASERLKRRLRVLAEGSGRMMMARFPSLTALGPGDLTAAGLYDISPEAVHGYRLMAGVALPTLIGLLLLAGASQVSLLPLLLLLTSAAAGWQAPSFVIRKRGSSRLEEIDHGLPELIDLLIATIEAGMGFSASLSLVAERFHGPIGEELKLTMKQQSLGLSIQQALDDMVERCDTPSIRSFVRTASRGESLGVSIGPVLRELSADQRRRYRQAAREKMQKAPIKMLFPLIFLIFPALMIVLMFPAAYSVAHNLSGIF
jgi:tight adherence protein C